LKRKDYLHEEALKAIDISSNKWSAIGKAGWTYIFKGKNLNQLLGNKLMYLVV
jgi:hypothetical protein